MSKLQPNNLPPNSKVSLKAINLRPPFIKIEDSSLNYRPYFYEMHSHPVILRDRYVKTSPFYYPHRTDAAGHAAASSKHNDTPPPVLNYVGFLHSSGYCEICEKEYRHINSHIKTKVHTSHALNDGTYAEIDEVIKKGFMNEKLPYTPKAFVDVTVLPGLLRTKIPVCNVKFQLQEKIDIKSSQIFTVGMYHNLSLNQGIVTYCSRSRNVPIEPLCLEYLNWVTKDSAVHPKVISLSKIYVPIESHLTEVPVCIVESTCMFAAKNKKLPFDCTTEAKMDLFLFPAPKNDVDILFSLLTQPKSLYKTMERSLKGRSEGFMPTEGMRNAVDQNNNFVYPDINFWNINDIIKAIKDIYVSVENL